MNDYYDFAQPFVPGTKVRSDDVNREYTLLEQAFDLLPSPEALAGGNAGLGIESGASNSYVLTLDSVRVVNTEGDQIIFKATHQNSGASTIAVDAIAAVPLVRHDGTPVQPGDILNGSYYEARYNSGSFYITSPMLETNVGVLVYATPTAQVGLSAIAGVATTVTRSDAAPALNQGIAPTWTGIHTFSLRTLFADGTAALPGLAFTTDPDTGVYRVAANRIGFTCGGVLQVDIDSTRMSFRTGFVVYGGDGSAAAPFYTFGTDTDTGVYRVTTNTIGFATAGTLRIAIGATLDATGVTAAYFADGTSSAPVICFGSDQNTGLYRIGADTLGIALGGLATFGFYQDATVNIATPGLSAYSGLHLTPRGANDDSIGITFGANSGGSSNNNTQAGIFVRSSGAYGTRMYFATTDNYATGAQVRAFITEAGRFGFADGTVAAPGLSFMGDLDTGFYRIGANNMGVAVNGTKIVEFSGVNTGEIGLTGGSASVPSLTFIGDTDTGLYHPAGNQIRIVVGGTIILDVAPTVFSVGSAAQLLVGNGAVGTPSVSFNTDGNTGLYLVGADNLGIATAGALALSIDAAQNLDGKGVAVCKFKTSDTARSSTVTLADDSDLAGVPLSVGKYAIDMWLKPHNVSTTAQGFQFKLNFSGTVAGGGYSSVGIENNVFTSRQPTSNYNTVVQAADITAASNFDYFHATGYLEVTVAGSMALQWSQKTSSANNTILDRGSYIKFTKLA